MKRLLVLTALAVLLAIPAAAPAAVTLPPGVTQTGPTSFAAIPSFCPSVCVSSIDGYTFTGIPYSPYVRDVFLQLPASTPVATDLWFDLRAQPGYTPGAPVYAVSGTVTITGTVGDDGT